MLDRAAGLGVAISDRDASFILLDLRDLGVVADEVPQFAPERPTDHAHAADRLKDHVLEFIEVTGGDRTPQPGLHQIAKGHRLRRYGVRGQAAARIGDIPSPLARQQAFLVVIVLVQCAPFAHGLEQDFPVFAGNGLIELALIGRLGE